MDSIIQYFPDDEGKCHHRFCSWTNDAAVLEWLDEHGISTFAKDGFTVLFDILDEPSLLGFILKFSPTGYQEFKGDVRHLY